MTAPEAQPPAHSISPAPTRWRIAAFLLPLVLLPAITFVALFLVLRAPPPWFLDVGTPGDTRFLAGFSIAETSTKTDPATDQKTTTFRWSVEESRLVLHGSGMGRFSLDMRLSGDQRAESGNWRVWLEHNEQAIATMEMKRGWRVYRVLLPPSVTTGSGVEASPLLLKSDPYTYTLHDHRSLGVPVDWIGLSPLAGGASPGPPLLWAASLAWGVAVLAGLLWIAYRGIFHRFSLSTPLATLWGGLPVVAVAGGLVVGAWRDPYSMAWAIPPLPWTLGLMTLLLLRIALPAVWPALVSRLAVGWGRHASILLLVGAQILFFAHRSGWSSEAGWAIGGGIAAAVAGILLLALPAFSGNRGQGAGDRGQGAGDRSERGQDSRRQAGRLRSHVENRGYSVSLLLLLIFAVALALRFFQLDTLPFGLWRDESRHGLIAIRMLEDPAYRPIYIASGGVNMPALGFYPFALAIKLWGIHSWSMRPMTALAGALTIFPLYGFAARLSGQRRIGLLAAALLAFSSWHITLSRFSFPSVFEPLLTLSGLWLMLHALELGTSERRGDNATEHAKNRFLPLLAAVGAGGFLGLAMQNYHTGRVVPVVAGVLALLLLLRNLHAWRRWFGSVVLMGVGFALALAPLTLYVLNNPAAFNSRVSKVFLLGEEARQGRPPLAVLDDSIGGHALMFNVRGDSNGRHHAPGRPMLDAITGLGFLAGCAVLLRRGGTMRFFLAAALAIGLLPSLLAVEYPHAMRSIGAVVFACTIAAIGLAEIANSWGTLLRSSSDRQFSHKGTEKKQWLTPRLASAVAPALLLAALALNTWTYFVAMPSNPAVWLSFYPIHTQVGDYVRNLAEQKGAGGSEQEASQQTRIDQVYVPSGLTSNSVFEYLAWGLPVQTFEERSVSRPVRAGALFVFSGYATPQQVAASLKRFSQTFAPPGAVFVHAANGPTLPDGSGPSFVVYRME